MRRLHVLTFLLLTLFLTARFSVHAETAAELQASIDSLTAQIQSLDKEIAEYNQKINTTQGQAKTLKAALAQLELRRAALAKQINSTRLKITATQNSIVITEGKIEVTETKLTQNQHALAETLRSLVYEEETVPPFVRTLSVGAKLSDLLDAVKQSTDASKAINDKVNALTVTKQDLDTQKSIYEASKQKLLSLNQTLTDQKQLVEATAQEKNMLLVQTKNQETQYQKLLADRKAKKDQLEAEMLDVESKLKAFTNVASLPRTGKGVLKYPVANVNITQYFGNTAFSTANPQVYNGGGHNGIDFAVKVGTPIMSAANGVVVGTGDTDRACSGVSYGKWVLVRHTNGLSTLYAHLSVIQASAGQTVKAGDQLGLSGNTGYSTGPHLHFTVYATEAVHIAGPTEYRSKVCGTYLVMPLAPVSGYLNPLSYL